MKVVLQTQMALEETEGKEQVSQYSYLRNNNAGSELRKLLSNTFTYLLISGGFGLYLDLFFYEACFDFLVKLTTHELVIKNDK